MAGQQFGIARHVVLVAHRDEGGGEDGAKIVFAQGLAGATDTSRQGLQIAPRLFSKGAEHALIGVGQAFKGGGVHGIGNAHGQAHARHQMMPKSAQNDRARALRMGKAKESRDAGAHRIAHDIGSVDIQPVEQGSCILGHFGRGIIIRHIKLLALPMAAIVQHDGAPPGMGQRLHP